MMEVVPYLYYEYYEAKKNDKLFKRSKIKCIIHLSGKERQFGSSSGGEFEEMLIDLSGYTLERSSEQQINVHLYSYLYDLIEFIYKKVVLENSPVCILGYEGKQDIDAILMAYFIKFAQVNYQEAHHYVMSKKMNNYYERSYYYPCLKKYAGQLELLKKIDY
jgi:hypothetical protein